MKHRNAKTNRSNNSIQYKCSNSSSTVSSNHNGKNNRKNSSTKNKTCNCSNR